VHAGLAAHICGDRREHQDALEPLAEHEDRDVEDTRCQRIVPQRVGHPAHDERRNEEQEDDGGETGRREDASDWE
jgi:hypothetical protein